MTKSYWLIALLLFFIGAAMGAWMPAWLGIITVFALLIGFWIWAENTQGSSALGVLYFLPHLILSEIGLLIGTGLLNPSFAEGIITIQTFLGLK